MHPREIVRDERVLAEHGVSISSETTGISLPRKYETQGFAGLQSDAREAGEAGRKAREIAEGTLGEPVVSPENYLHLKRVSGDQKRSKKSLPQEPTLVNEAEEEKTQGT